MEWQPIETAPKDGRSILGFQQLNPLPTNRIVVLRFDAEKTRWQTDVFAFVPFAPTHWMPLPEAPK